MQTRPASRMVRFIRQDGFFPLALLVVVLAAYGLGMSGLSFQGDDWHMIWLQYRIGSLDPFFNLTRFSTQWLFQVLMPFMAPLAWQWFALMLTLHWLGGMSLYFFLKELLPEKEIEAGPFALLYALYPGFLMSFYPLSFLFQFFQPACLFLSFYFMTVWIHTGARKESWKFILSIVLEAANLLLSEYYFLFEILRPLVIWLAMKNKSKKQPNLRAVLQTWRPFLAVFLAILGVRIWTQVSSNGRAMITLGRFSWDASAFLAQFGRQAVQDLNAIFIQPLLAAVIPHLQLHSTQDWLAACGAAITGITVLIYLSRHPDQSSPKKVRWYWLVAGSLVIFLLAALPFWLAGIKSYFGFELRNRTALPQGLGFTLLLFTLLMLIPSRLRWLRNITIACLAGGFALLQLQSAGQFRTEWERRKEMMQQLAWRAPQLEPGTVMLINDPGFVLSGENSLAAELNWNYVSETHPKAAQYFIYFNEHRFLGDFADRHANRVVEQMHMIGPTALNPTRLLVLQYEAGGCLRVLDPQLDIFDKEITSFTHRYIQEAKPEVIKAEDASESRKLDENIYGKEEAHGWCYYFEKVDLARQLGDWQAAGEFAQRGLAMLPEQPKPAELIPFIEALAHTREWDKARGMSEGILKQDASQSRMMCLLWQRMAAGTENSQAKAAGLAWMTITTGCNFS